MLRLLTLIIRPYAKCTKVMAALLALAGSFLAFAHPAAAGEHAYTLRIELTPAICAMQSQRSSLRQCQEGFSMTVAGLRPEYGERERIQCSDKKANLAPLQTKIVSRIMPDEVLRDIVWQRYGSCTGMSNSSYFRLITSLSGGLNVPKELSSGGYYLVDHGRFIGQLANQNPGLSPESVQLFCQADGKNNTSILTELQVCYDSNAKFTQCQKSNKSNCPEKFIIQGLP